MTLKPYAQMIDIKRWADRALYDIVARHSQQLSAEEASIMLRILDHMLAVDRIFRHHLEGTPHGMQAPRSDTLPTLADLSADSSEVDDWYARYAAGLTAEACEEVIDVVFTSGKRIAMRRGEILLHVCLHGTYHRGNAGAVLQLKGIDPGRDAVTDFLEDQAQAHHEHAPGAFPKGGTHAIERPARV